MVKGHRMTKTMRVYLQSDANRNFGGTFIITAVKARTDWARPFLKPLVEIDAEAKLDQDPPSQMKNLSMLVAPDVLTHCLDVFQSDLQSQIEDFEKKFSASRFQQVKAGMALIASKLSLLIEGDPRWSEIVQLIINDNDSNIASAPELADCARAAIEAAIPSADEIEVLIDKDDRFSETPDEMMQQITQALEVAMSSRHARALILELKDFFEYFSIRLGRP